MSLARKYKEAETKLAKSVAKQSKSAAFSIKKLFTDLINSGKQRFTVMLIPHSEKIFNFQISVFWLIFMTAVLVTVMISFFTLTILYTGMKSKEIKNAENTATLKATVEALRDSMSDLSGAMGRFESEYALLKQSFDQSSIKDNISNLSVGSTNAVISEVDEIQKYREFLSQTSEEIRQLSSSIFSQKELLVDLPTQWPLQNGVGAITGLFGLQEHPIQHVLYIHRGMDIAASTGTPIVAPANGKIIERGYDPGNYGNYVIIKHKYGFITRYGHMSAILVAEGEDVSQGDIIGLVGNTGMSTGSHLHYEVQIGSEVVDPAYYLRIRNKF